MNSTRLVLVVCDELRSTLSNVAPIQLGHVKLLIHDVADACTVSEKHWHQDRLAAEIEATLKREQIPSVRIAAHMRTVFNPIVQHGFQVRFEKEENELKLATGITDVQVWGFRHEARDAPIWAALDAVRSAQENSTLNENTRAELGSKLDLAFVEASAKLLSEQFTIDRHCIMGLYVPIRLNLELAAERAKNRTGDPAPLIDEVLQKFPAKSEEARRLFEKAMNHVQHSSPRLR
jgi:hypothetical protein